MLQRTILRYLTHFRAHHGHRRLLTTRTPSTGSSGVAASSASLGGPSGNTSSKSASIPTASHRSSEYTAGTVQPAQQWHRKSDGGGSVSGDGGAGDVGVGTGGGKTGGSESGRGGSAGGGRRPARGGQNLSARYARLENAVRGKQARAEAQAANVASSAATMAGAILGARTVPIPEDAGVTVTGTGTTQDQLPPAVKKTGKAAEMFRGFVVPEEPKPPADDECCMSGCAVCVYDLHEEELEAYDAALTTLRASLVALGVPQAEWPARVRTASASTPTPTPTSPSTSASASTSASNPASASASSGSTSSSPQSQDKSRKGAVLSAFEEMERRLAEKHKAEAKAEAEGAAITTSSSASASANAGPTVEASGAGQTVLSGMETNVPVAGTGSGSDEGSIGRREQAHAAAPVLLSVNHPDTPDPHEPKVKVAQQAPSLSASNWRERQQLAAQTQKAARRKAFWNELYEGVRWVLFSNR